MIKNQVIIFPQNTLQAWDHLPRFTFLEADLSKSNRKVEFKSDKRLF